MSGNEMYSVVNGLKTDRWIHAEILGEDFDDVPVKKSQPEKPPQK